MKQFGSFRFKNHKNPNMFNPSALEATSAAEACRDATGLLVDHSECELASLLTSWSSDYGHEERSFERPTQGATIQSTILREPRFEQT